MSSCGDSALVGMMGPNQVSHLSAEVRYRRNVQNVCLNGNNAALEHPVVL